MNNFIENLKKSPDFKNDFSFIELKSYKETIREGVNYLQFDVTCSKNKQG